MKPGKTGIARIIAAAGYSWLGLKAAFINEAAFRQELLLFFILAPAAFWVGHSKIEIVVLIGSLFIVLITELLNLAIEAVVDRTGNEKHVLSGRAKDIGSAAVLVSLINVMATWAIIILL